MSMSRRTIPTAGLALFLGVASPACNSGTRGTNNTAAAPMDTTTASADTAMARDTTSVVADTTAADTLAASENQQAAGAQPTTPPPQTRADTPPARSPKPAAQAATGGSKVTQEEYEGWRQYSVNCARCHGQDVLPNPVAANLLVSLAPGGPIDTYEKFFQAVNEGRPERGMPAFKGLLSPDQTKSIHGYVKGRAEKRIPPGRPASPG